MKSFLNIASTFWLISTVYSKAIASLRPTCPTFPPQPDNGFFECTSGNEIGSLCYFYCNQGYTLDGPIDTLCVQESSQEIADWDFPTPVCIEQTRMCTDDQKADVIIAIDSSISFGEENFEIAKDFSENFIRSFSLERNVTRFSVFRYNNGVDTNSQILLRDSDDREQLLHEIQEIPNSPQGNSNVGNALRHIHDVIQTEQNGDRSAIHNIVILFTGSLSNDDVTIPAQQLRIDSDIFIVGMNHLEPSLKYIDQMNEITRSAQNIILTEPGQDAEVIDDALSRRLGEVICRN